MLTHGGCGDDGGVGALHVVFCGEAPIVGYRFSRSLSELRDAPPPSLTRAHARTRARARVDAHVASAES